jgi:rubrerythrin
VGHGHSIAVDGWWSSSSLLSLSLLLYAVFGWDKEMALPNKNYNERVDLVEHGYRVDSFGSDLLLERLHEYHLLLTTHTIKRRLRCSECNIYFADPPSRLCPGCEAYREHQT